MELVHMLVLVLYGITYVVAAPCSRDAAKVILVKENGEKEIIRNADAEDIIKSLSIQNEFKKDDLDSENSDEDTSSENYSHLILDPEEKDSSVMIAKKMSDSNVKKTAYKKSMHHNNMPRQASSSPEQGIWAWRGKKDSSKRQNDKRNWSYFSSKMRHIMKKQHRKPYGDEKQGRENDEYQYASRRDDEYLNNAENV